MAAYPVEVIRLDCQDDSEEEILVPDFVHHSVTPNQSSIKRDGNSSKSNTSRGQGRHYSVDDITIIKHDVEDILEKSCSSEDSSCSKKRKLGSYTTNAKMDRNLKILKDSGRQKRANKKNTEPEETIILLNDNTPTPTQPAENEKGGAFEGTIIHQFDMTSDDYENAIAASYLSSNYVPDEATTHRQEDQSTHNEEVQEPEDIRGFDLDSCIGSLEIHFESFIPSSLQKNKDNKKGVFHAKSVSKQIKHIFYCLRCFDPLEKKEDFRSHECVKYIDSNRPKNSDKCEQCEARISNQRIMHEHELLYHGESVTYKCPLCSQKFGRLWRLKTHVTKTHEKCQLCSYRSLNRNDKLEHVMSVHSSELDILREISNEKSTRGPDNSEKAEKYEKYEDKIIRVKPNCCLLFPDGKIIHYENGKMINMDNGESMVLVPRKRCIKKTIRLVNSVNKRPLRSTDKVFGQNTVRSAVTDTSDPPLSPDVIEVSSSPLSSDVEIINGDSDNEPAQRRGRIISLDGDIRDHDDISANEVTESRVAVDTPEQVAVGDTQVVKENAASEEEPVAGAANEVPQTYLLDNPITVAFVGDKLVNVETGDEINVVSAVISEEDYMGLSSVCSFSDIKPDVNSSDPDGNVETPASVVEKELKKSP